MKKELILQSNQVSHIECGVGIACSANAGKILNTKEDPILNWNEKGQKKKEK